MGPPIARQHPSNAISSCLDIFVLPNPDHSPISFLHTTVRITIALAIRRNLCSPPFPISFWRSSVNRTSMPIAAVDENGDTETRKYQIGSTAQTGHRLAVDKKAKATAMELRSQCNLRPGIPLPLATHTKSYLLRGSRGSIARGTHSALKQCSISWGISFGLSIPTNPDNVVVQPAAVTTAEGPTTAAVTAGHSSFASVA